MANIPGAYSVAVLPISPYAVDYSESMDYNGDTAA